jgi:hypothetical protein
MKENKFQSKLIKKLESQGAWVLNVHGHKWQKSGVSDSLVIHKNWKGFLELKVGKNKVSPLQKAIAEKLIKRGFPCFVVRCVQIDAYSGIIFDAYNKLIIEDYNGNILCEPAGLDKVLDCCISLSNGNN